jgi:hypothetical protein
MQNSTPSIPRSVGAPRKVPESTINEIRRRVAAGLVFGEQKCIAYELNLSRSFVNQVIRGHRRKERAS